MADVRGLFAYFCRGFPDRNCGKLRPRYTVCRPHFGHCFASANLRWQGWNNGDLLRPFRIDPLIWSGLILLFVWAFQTFSNIKQLTCCTAHLKQWDIVQYGLSQNASLADVTFYNSWNSEWTTQEVVNLTIWVLTDVKLLAKYAQIVKMQGFKWAPNWSNGWMFPTFRDSFHVTSTMSLLFKLVWLFFLVDSKEWKSSTVSAESRPEMVAPDLALWGRPGHPVPCITCHKTRDLFVAFRISFTIIVEDQQGFPVPFWWISPKTPVLDLVASNPWG